MNVDIVLKNSLNFLKNHILTLTCEIEPLKLIHTGRMRNQSYAFTPYMYDIYFNRLMHLFSFFTELSFKRRLLLFLQENQFYIPDFRFNFTLLELSEDEVYELYVNGNFKIQATRAKFQHSNLPNTTVRIKAMHELRDGLSNIKFEKPKPMSDNHTGIHF